MMSYSVSKVKVLGIFLAILLLSTVYVMPQQVSAYYKLDASKVPTDVKSKFDNTLNCQIGITVSFLAAAMIAVAGFIYNEAAETAGEEGFKQAMKNVLKKQAAQAAVKGSAKGHIIGYDVLFNKLGMPDWATTLVNLVVGLLVGAMLALTLFGQGWAALLIQTAAMEAFFWIATLVANDCAPVIIPGNVGWDEGYSTVDHMDANTSVKVTNTNFQYTAPGDANYMQNAKKKASSTTQCGEIILYPIVSDAGNELHLGSFDKDDEDGKDKKLAQMFVIDSLWSGYVKWLQAFDSDINSHPTLKKIGTVDTKKQINTEHPETKERIEKELDAVLQSQRHELESKDASNAEFVYDYDVFLAGIGSHKVKIVGYNYAGVNLPTVRNSFDITLQVNEKNNPTIVPGPPLKLEAFFPTGTIPPLDLQKRILTQAKAYDDCTDNLTITTNLPQILDENRGMLPLGFTDVTLVTIDSSGNTDSKILQLLVTDSIPPDIHPLEDIGVTINKDKSSIQGTKLLDDSFGEPILKEPLVFDLTSKNPLIQCNIKDSQELCKDHSFLVNKITAIEWTVSDDYNNKAHLAQNVLVKYEGDNKKPEAYNSVAAVATGIETPIMIEGNDDDADKLSFIMTHSPEIGGFTTDPKAVFQNRYSLEGFVNDLSNFDIQYRQSTKSQHFALAHNVIPSATNPVLDPVLTRPGIYQLEYSDSGKKNSAGYIDLSTLGLHPDKIEFADSVPLKSNWKIQMPNDYTLDSRFTLHDDKPDAGIKSGFWLDMDENSDSKALNYKNMERITLVPQPNYKRILVIGEYTGMIDVIDLDHEDLTPHAIYARDPILHNGINQYWVFDYEKKEVSLFEYTVKMNFDVGGLQKQDMGIGVNYELKHAYPLSKIQNPLASAYDYKKEIMYVLDKNNGSINIVEIDLNIDELWSKWSTLDGLTLDSESYTVSKISVVYDANNRQNVFGIGPNNQVLQKRQTDSGWSTWQDLGGQLIDIRSAKDKDGRLHIFGVNSANDVWYKAQYTGGGWQDWQTFKDKAVKEIVLSKKNDGYLQLFAADDKNRLWTSTQGGSDSWSDWKQIGDNNTWIAKIQVGKNQDGRLEVFGIGEGNENGGPIFHTWQTGVGSDSWSDWNKFPDHNLKEFVVSTQSDGRLEIFAIDAIDSKVYHIWQKSPNSSWDNWAEIPSLVAKKIDANTGADNKMQVFAIGMDNQLHQSKQHADGTFRWDSLGGQLVDIKSAKGKDGRLHIAGINSNHEVFHMAQDPDGSWTKDSWTDLSVDKLKLKPGAVELIDEDLKDGIDNDGDGWIDEDDNITFGNKPAKINACGDAITLVMNSDQAISLTCDDMRIESLHGEPVIMIKQNSNQDYFGLRLTAGNTIYYDHVSNMLSIDEKNKDIIEYYSSSSVDELQTKINQHSSGAVKLEPKSDSNKN